MVNCKYKKGKDCMWNFEPYNREKVFCILLKNHCCEFCKKVINCPYRCGKIDEIAEEDNPSKRYIKDKD